MGVVHWFALIAIHSATLIKSVSYELSYYNMQQHMCSHRVNLKGNSYEAHKISRAKMTFDKVRVSLLPLILHCLLN